MNLITRPRPRPPPMDKGLYRTQGQLLHPWIRTEQPNVNGLIDQADEKVPKHAAESLKGIRVDAESRRNGQRRLLFRRLRHTKYETRRRLTCQANCHSGRPALCSREDTGSPLLQAGNRVRILHGLESLHEPFAAAVLTVGNFDGVHRAHQHLLKLGRQLSNASRCPLVVLTFEPHPLTVVAPSKAPARLSTLEEKLSLLARSGVDVVVVAKSEPELLGIKAEAFVRDVLVRRFHPRHIVEGPSFGFGRGRKGNPELLKRLAPQCGFDMHVVEPVVLELEHREPMMVSSSLIRRLLHDGRVDQAARCLGRPYALSGAVIAGAGRGRAIGVPTANLALTDVLVPAEGVYAAVAVVDSGRYAAAVSIGRTPTFDGAALQVEAHLLEFEGDLYGQTIRLEFLSWLRGQEKFDSPDALRAQLARDVEAVRRSEAVGTAIQRSDAVTP